ncbi:hypothetical protein OGM63_09340 [Plectonema radiosum NIES-515]|uniref:Uncharacterized protein n=1 Tax=Plectonema radiosum NIES-515 TaxID=2986073 RepID=A0ABT3AX57_9CYAN|nr:hypothetical protein [Plectonema radiosum]MCV3213713.1 hypothetical protein [Plectonema radiosum NIES-515]
MADGYEVITPEEIEAENTFREGKARIDSNDIGGGINLLRRARDMFRNCHSSQAEAKADEVEKLLISMGDRRR